VVVLHVYEAKLTANPLLDHGDRHSGSMLQHRDPTYAIELEETAIYKSCHRHADDCNTNTDSMRCQAVRQPVRWWRSSFKYVGTQSV